MHLEQFRGPLVAAATIIALAAVGCSSAPTTSTAKSTTTSSASPINTIRQAMPATDAQATDPSWLEPGSPASGFAVDMRVGQTMFTLLSPSEYTQEPDVALLEARDGTGTCISYGMRVWDKPGNFIDAAQLNPPNAVVARTGPNAFTIAAPDEVRVASNFTTPVVTCKGHPRATILSDARSVAPLGYPTDLKVGTTRYIPAALAWVGTSSSSTAEILAESSAASPFPGSVPLVMTNRGLVIPIKYRDKLNVVGADQIAADKPSHFPQATIN